MSFQQSTFPFDQNKFHFFEFAENRDAQEATSTRFLLFHKAYNTVFSIHAK